MEHFPEWLRLSIFAITQIVMLVGLLGLVIPIFPGIVVIWLAGLAYGVVTGFDSWAIVFFAILTLLMLAGTTVDNLLMGAGARKGGASWLTIGVALFAGLVGTLALPPFGGLIAAPLSVLLLEFWRTRDAKKSARALLGLATGYGLSFFVRFGIGVVMMIVWWLWVWKG